MPFGPLRLPHLSQLSAIASGSSSTTPIVSNAGSRRRTSLRRKGKNRTHFRVPWTIPDYGSTTTVSGAATPQRLEDVREDPESLRGTASSDVLDFEGEGPPEDEDEEEFST